ncbi:hypothetical protein AQJ30_23905 [Streptomyces longwoodensis]|uniref:Uncharacterized protein n=1 Tax=Streptomyces longwoodensis TaxID=68231 RepID=A0A101QTG8_9ACTN|nr:hypothetical protein [Streptomyces longwoodensis]KUN35735.1 hypothetical protein AQJ30_23905 [Streptomyces longwoodensis]
MFCQPSTPAGELRGQPAARYSGALPQDHGREIRITISDEPYEQLEERAAKRHLPPEAYAGQVMDADLTQARFREGARALIGEHAEKFGKRFGGPTQSSADAA